LPLLNRALGIYQDIYGNKAHAEVAVTLNDLGVLHFDAGNFNQAEIALRKALEMYMELFGTNPEAGDCLMNLGDCYEALEEPEKAFAEYANAKYCFESLFGYDHPKTRIARRMMESVQN
jgi:tetratricopeptide (TPR) repeat protein